MVSTVVDVFAAIPVLVAHVVTLLPLLVLDVVVVVALVIMVILCVARAGKKSGSDCSDSECFAGPIHRVLLSLEGFSLSPGFRCPRPAIVRSFGLRKGAKDRLKSLFLFVGCNLEMPGCIRRAKPALRSVP